MRGGRNAAKLHCGRPLDGRVRRHFALKTVSRAKSERFPCVSWLSRRICQASASGFQVTVLKNGPSGYSNLNSIEFPTRFPLPTAEYFPPKTSVQWATYSV